MGKPGMKGSLWSGRAERGWGQEILPGWEMWGEGNGT